MLTDYTTVLDALKARGLPAVFDSDRLGDYIVITLGGTSKVTIGDLDDDLPYPQPPKGGPTTYPTLAGAPIEPPFYRTADTDVDSLADAVADYVRLRNSTWLAAQMTEL